MNKDKKIIQLKRKLQGYEDFYWFLKKFEHHYWGFLEEETKELTQKMSINLRKVRSHTSIELEELQNGK